MTTELSLFIIATTVVVAAGFSLFARWSRFSPAVPTSKLDQLQAGMSTDEVISLLGQPRKTRAGNRGREWWTYGSNLKRHRLVIEFSDKKRVVQFVHDSSDSAQPGSVKED